MSKKSARHRRQRAEANKAALDKKDGSPVVLIEDHKLEYPGLWLEIYVAGDGPTETKLINELFSRAKCTKAADPEHADIVIFGGGSDVNPDLYGAEKHPMTSFNIDRDRQDKELYDFCVDKGIPMIGICRGSQFGWAMAGGKLYQHVDEHVGDHSMYVPRTKEYIHRISSVHHQMVKWDADAYRMTGARLLGTSHKSKVRYEGPGKYEEGSNMDVEAYYLPDVCFFGVQGHPEYRGYPRYSQWFLEQIVENVINNPHIKNVRNYLRVQKFDIEQAKEKIEQAREGAKKVLEHLSNDNPQENA